MIRAYSGSSYALRGTTESLAAADDTTTKSLSDMCESSELDCGGDSSAMIVVLGCDSTNDSPNSSKVSIGITTCGDSESTDKLKLKQPSQVLARPESNDLGTHLSNFPLKLFEMLQCEDTRIVGWHTEISFKIRNSKRFMDTTLPKYFPCKLNSYIGMYVCVYMCF